MDLITYIVEKNKADNTEKKDDKSEVSIQYDEILMSNLLKQSGSEYYVLAYDAEDVYYDTYNTYITSYTGKDDALRVYTSILSNSFNKSFYDADAESNTDVDSIDKLKLNKSENRPLVTKSKESTIETKVDENLFTLLILSSILL